MFIPQIRVFSIQNNSASKVRYSSNSQTPSFHARLNVSATADDARTSHEKFNYVVSLFRDKLSKDPLNKSDVVHLRKIDALKANSVAVGESYLVTPGKWVSNGNYGQHFVRDTVPSANPYEEGVRKPVPSYYTKATKYENLDISINKSRTGFYFNDDHSAEQIAEDMYNCYKHVRYLEHYQND